MNYLLAIQRQQGKTVSAVWDDTDRHIMYYLPPTPVIMSSEGQPAVKAMAYDWLYQRVLHILKNRPPQKTNITSAVGKQVKVFRGAHHRGKVGLCFWEGVRYVPKVTKRERFDIRGNPLIAKLGTIANERVGIVLEDGSKIFTHKRYISELPRTPKERSDEELQAIAKRIAQSNDWFILFNNPALIGF